jgi:3-deoxy-manno-octulosonate cytidylyltransferase (CMP-KDO synthetase)
MVVRTAERALASGASAIMVATDHADIVAACEAHGVPVCMTRPDHPSGTDRIAEVAASMQLPADAVVVNVQGDEPLIDPALIAATAALVNAQVPMATAAHPLHEVAEVFNPNVVKVVLDKSGRALYFRAQQSPGIAMFARVASSCWLAIRRCGTLVCMPTAMIFTTVSATRYLASGADRSARTVTRAVARLSDRAVHVTQTSPAPGVDTLEDLEQVRRIFFRKMS